MDYRSLLAIPIATLALSASSADTLRLPNGWQGGASLTWPASATYAYGVAPDSEHQASRALTVQALGRRQPTELGAVWQSMVGYTGKRVRFTAEVKAAGTDGWAGLVVRDGFLPLYLLPVGSDEPEPATQAGAPACPDWCEVSVVADIPADGLGAATVGLALLGNGQVWARGFRLEVVGPDTPLTTHRFAAAQTAATREQIARTRQAQASQPTPPDNLALR